MNGLLHHLILSLKLNFRSKQAILYGYVVPIFFLIAFGAFFRSGQPPLMREMGELLTVTILGGACFGMPTTMVAERERGVWRRYRLVPAATGGIILSAMVARFVIILSAALLQILLARAIYGTFFPQHPLQLLLGVMIVSFAFLGLGLVIAMVSNNVPAVQQMGQAVFLPMIMIGGVGVPWWTLPHAAQHVAQFFPGIYAVNLLESCHVGKGLADQGFNIAALIAIGLASLLAGGKLFRWDMGQRLIPGAKKWVAIAIVAWLCVGSVSDATDHFTIRQSARNQTNYASQAEHPAARPDTNDPSSSSGAVTANVPSATQPSPSTTGPAAQPTRSSVAIAIDPPATQGSASAPPSTGPAANVEPPMPASWDKVTQANIDAVTYDDLPPDQGTVIPFAHDLNQLNDDDRKRIEAFNDALNNWAPGQVNDIPQRVRNLLSICAVSDIMEDPNEQEIPFVVYDYMRANIQKDQLIKALTWIILNDKDGTVLTDVRDIKELNIDGQVPEDSDRERITGYAKKMLFRLLGKMPAA